MYFQVYDTNSQWSNKHHFFNYVYVLQAHASEHLFYIITLKLGGSCSEAVLLMLHLLNCSVLSVLTLSVFMALFFVFFNDNLHWPLLSISICFALETQQLSTGIASVTGTVLEAHKKIWNRHWETNLSSKRFWVKCVDAACLAHSHFCMLFKAWP